MSNIPQAHEEQSDAMASMRPRRSYVAQIISDTFGRSGSRFGFGFLLIIGILAVIAPFIANTHPFVMKTVDGEITFPLFDYLHAVDVILLVCSVVGALLLMMRSLPRTQRWYIFLATLVIVSVVSALFVRQPATVPDGYERYRVMEKAGSIEWAYYTIIPYSPRDRLRDQPDARNNAPSGKHWFGTERDGADVLSRMIHACRIMLSIGFISTSIAMLIGVIIGGLMGYFSGIVDLIGMRLVEIFQSIPQLYLLLTFVAFFGRGPYTLYFLMIIIGLTSWTGYARFTRAEYLRLREQDFVQAARACGIPLSSVLFRHMLPNGVAPVLVSATFGVASAILAEAMLSFLGLGLIDEPSWGQMLSQATGSGGGFLWWIATFPGGRSF